MQTVYEASIDTIAKHYGLDHQQMKTIEELGEAGSAIARHVLEPGDANLEHMAEELADVQIMIDQLLVLSPMLKFHFEKQKYKKIKRQIRRMVEDARLNVD